MREEFLPVCPWEGLPGRLQALLLNVKSMEDQHLCWGGRNLLSSSGLCPHNRLAQVDNVYLCLAQSGNSYYIGVQTQPPQVNMDS